MRGGCRLAPLAKTQFATRMRLITCRGRSPGRRKELGPRPEVALLRRIVEHASALARNVWELQLMCSHQSTLFVAGALFRATSQSASCKSFSSLFDRYYIACHSAAAPLT
jgi:hypothetical protein